MRSAAAGSVAAHQRKYGGGNNNNGNGKSTGNTGRSTTPTPDVNNSGANTSALTAPQLSFLLARPRPKLEFSTTTNPTTGGVGVSGMVESSNTSSQQQQRQQQQSSGINNSMPSTGHQVEEGRKNGNNSMNPFRDSNTNTATTTGQGTSPSTHPNDDDPRDNVYDDDDDGNNSQSRGDDDDGDDNSNKKDGTYLEKWQKFRLLCGDIVNHPKVQLMIVFLIAVNAIMMGVQTFDFIKDIPRNLEAFELTDKIFLIIFTIELGMQFVYRGWRLVTDGWLVFDLIIILTSWSFQEAQIVRAFRIFRALRLITRIQVMQNLVLALFSVMPRMFAIFVLLCLVSYIFAVMFTQLFKKIDPVYFGRIDKTIFTLFQIMTLDAWSDIAREVMEVYKWAWLPFIVFVIVTGFVVVNLMIAVICDAIAALHEDEKAKLHGTYEDDENGNSSSSDTGLDMHEQIDALELHIAELSKMQEQTLQVVASLTQQLAHANRQLQEQQQNNQTSNNGSSGGGN